MAYVTRAMREKMRDDATANSPDRVAERLRARQAGELAHADMVAKFPTLTPDNVREALNYQADRYAFHYNPK